MPSDLEARQALESFILSPELIQLETRFATFNVFEALGVARRELNHSSFLAFLLNPQESHGLRDLFLRRFLQDVVRVASEPTVSAIELDDLDLSRIEIRREYQNIDILVSDPLNRFLVVIENKVGTTQHDDQLSRYHKIVTQAYPDHRFVGVYLTPGGEDSKNPHYASYTYEGVRSIINDLLMRESILLPQTFRSVLEQYGDLLDRRFMADQKLQELCAKIYKRHKIAVDILLKNIPDEFGRALAIVKSLVEATGFSPLESDPSTVRFVPDAFNKIKAFQSEAAWLETGQMVYLECKKKNDGLVFQAKMDGGLPEERASVHRFAQQHQPPFKVDRTVYAKYQNLYSQPLLGGTALSDMDDLALEAALTDAWSKFVNTTVDAMSKAACEHYS